MSRILIITILLLTCAKGYGQHIYQQKRLDRDRLNKYKEKYKYTPPPEYMQWKRVKAKEGSHQSETDDERVQRQTERAGTEQGDNLPEGERRRVVEGSEGKNVKPEGREPIEIREKDERQTTKNKENNLNDESNSSSTTLSTVLLIVLGAVIVGFLILLIVKNKNNKDSKVKKPVKQPKSDEESLHEIPKSVLQQNIEECLKNSDYRKAIRFYYLFILKELSEKKWITWKKEKTNDMYLVEMGDKQEYTAFQKTTRIYEITWYGNNELNYQDFQKIEPVYRNFISHLSPDTL